MKFGNPSQFAVEAQLEPGPESAAVISNNLAGRIRVCIGGREVGDFDDPLCWLGTTRNHLKHLGTQLHRLWDPSLDGLSMEEIFDRLDYLYYAVHRGKSVTSDWSPEERQRHERESDGSGRFSFLDSSEAFDGCKAFLVRPDATHLVALWSLDPCAEVFSHRFPIEDFENAVDAFSTWLQSEEQRLLPRRR